METFFEIFLHLDIYLNKWLLVLGPSIYILLFVIIFCETGLVVIPFLPGDSLLFATGTLCATDNAVLKLVPVILTLSAAAMLGDAVNYAIGHYVGPKVFYKEGGRWLNRNHLLATEAFYERHGGKTIFLARFFPIFRTFAPFVAGIGQMQYKRFFLFNISGGISWVLLFVCLGYYFANIPIVKQHFEVVILSIIIASCMPIIYRTVKSYLNKPRTNTL